MPTDGLTAIKHVWLTVTSEQVNQTMTLTIRYSKYCDATRDVGPEPLGFGQPDPEPEPLEFT